jgi:hypothetical protein
MAAQTQALACALPRPWQQGAGPDDAGAAASPRLGGIEKPVSDPRRDVVTTRSLVGLAGIEPATSALSVLRSNRLSYSPGVRNRRSSLLFRLSDLRVGGRYALYVRYLVHPRSPDGMCRLLIGGSIRLSVEGQRDLRGGVSNPIHHGPYVYPAGDELGDVEAANVMWT